MKRAISAFVEEPAEAPRSVAEGVYHVIRQDIVWGRLSANTPLRSDDLRKKYRVGISPLREALSRLVGERLVTTVAQRGFRVAALSAEDVLDIMETRLVIEREALSRSVQAGDLAWEREVVANYHALSRLAIPTGPGPNAELWTSLHRQFHLSLLGASGSRWQVELSAHLFDHAERYRVVRAIIVPRPKLIRDIAAEHRRLFDAVMSRNVRAALKALDHHYRATAESVVAALRHAPRLETVQKRRPARRTTRGVRSNS
jgi:GntR family transcriptional regulator, carbon starvation induced regulator